MLRKPAALITGASGEIGHGLIERLAESGERPVITIDLKPLEPELGRLVAHELHGSILDANLLERILSEFEVDLVFHLAALLSTRSEFTPVAAHQVNVEGTMNLLEFAQKQGESHGNWQRRSGYQRTQRVPGPIIPMDNNPSLLRRITSLIGKRHD